MSVAQKLQTIEKNQTKVYDAGKAKGYEEGKSEGGVSDPAAEAVMALMSRSIVTTLDGTSTYSAGVFYCAPLSVSEDFWQGSLSIVPAHIVEIKNDALSCITDAEAVLCLPTVPPKADRFGWWSPNGGSNTPKAIYVPDGSVDAYKAAENWSEFADLIKPMSELTEGV